MEHIIIRVSALKKPLLELIALCRMAFLSPQPWPSLTGKVTVKSEII